MRKIFALFAFLPCLCLAREITLKQFVSNYFDSDEIIMVQKLRLKQSVNSFEAIKNRYSLSSKLSYYNKKNEYEFPGGTSYDLKSNVLEASLAQTIPTGTQLTLEGQYHYSEHSEFTKDQRNYSYSLMVSQPVYRNAFGSLFSREKSYLGRIMDSAHEQTATQLMSSCSEASLSYLDAYITQEKVKTYELIEKDAIKVWRFMQKAYKKRLVGKLSFLSAKADWYDKQRLTEEFKKTLSDKLDVLTKYLEISKNDKLSSPFAHFDLVMTNKVTTKNNKELLRLKSLAKAKAENYHLQKNASRSDVNVFVKAGQSTTRNDYSFSVTGDNENRFVMAGVTASLPLIEKQSDAKVSNALIDKMISEKEVHKYQKDLEQAYKISNRKHSFYQDQVKTIKDKLSLYKERAEVAFKNMKSGKIDLLDYISYRDSYSREALTLLDAYNELYKSKFELLVEGSSLPKYCEEL